MNEARRKLRICLVCIVVAAVVVGFIYYFHDVRGNERISEGTLVRREVGEIPCLETARQFI